MYECFDIVSFEAGRAVRKIPLDNVIPAPGHAVHGGLDRRAESCTRLLEHVHWYIHNRRYHDPPRWHKVWRNLVLRTLLTEDLEGFAASHDLWVSEQPTLHEAVAVHEHRLVRRLLHILQVAREDVSGLLDVRIPERNFPEDLRRRQQRTLGAPSVRVALGWRRHSGTVDVGINAYGMEGRAQISKFGRTCMTDRRVAFSFEAPCLWHQCQGLGAARMWEQRFFGGCVW